jgi:hypothetical protein
VPSVTEWFQALGGDSGSQHDTELEWWITILTQCLACTWLFCGVMLCAGKVFSISDFATAVAESQQVGRLGKVLLKLH